MAGQPLTTFKPPPPLPASLDEAMDVGKRANFFLSENAENSSKNCHFSTHHFCILSGAEQFNIWKIKSQ